MFSVFKKKRYLDKKIETIGFLDIETKTDSFKASSGYIITWVLKKVNLKTGKSKKYYMTLNKEQNPIKQPKLDFDRHLLVELVRTMRECNLIVTHYGTWFDIPFIRTRCDRLGINFINYNDKIRFADTWKMARLTGSYKSNSLDFVARSLGIKLHKTKVDYEQWAKAVWGDKKAIKYILKHNDIDVEVLQKVFEKLEYASAVSGRYY